MVKKLQALKAKKGFTLVELVVVIAIIGVLAAILIPTMIGVVQDSRISSADTAASQIRTQVTTFFTKADTAGYPFQGPAKADKAGTVKAAVKDGDWAISLGTAKKAEFLKPDGKTEVIKLVSNSKTDTDAEKSLAAFMKANLSDIKNAYIEITVDNEKCLGVVYVDGVSASPSGVSLPTAGEFENAKGVSSAFPKDGKAGVNNNVVIGTNPKLGKAS